MFPFLLFCFWLFFDFEVWDTFRCIRIEISCKSDLSGPPDLNSGPQIFKNRYFLIFSKYWHFGDLIFKILTFLKMRAMSLFWRARRGLFFLRKPGSPFGVPAGAFFFWKKPGSPFGVPAGAFFFLKKFVYIEFGLPLAVLGHLWGPFGAPLAPEGPCGSPIRCQARFGDLASAEVL